jgi:hypothetical protein
LRGQSSQQRRQAALRSSQKQLHGKMQEGCLNEQMTGVKKFGETAFGLSFPISANRF